MKSEPKAFASLSSGLLARKGSARPAMRPQGFGQGGSLEDLGWNDMGHEAPRPTLTPIDGLAAAPEPQVSRTPLAGLTPISPVHDQHAELEQRFGTHDEDETEYEFEAEEEGYETFPQPVEAEGEDYDALELEDELPEAMPEPMLAPEPEAAIVPLVQPVPEPEPEFVAETLPRSSPKRAKAPRSRQSAKEKAAFTLRLDPNRHLKLRLACAVNAKSAQQLVTSALDKLLASMPELDAMASKAPEPGNRKD